MQRQASKTVPSAVTMLQDMTAWCSKSTSLSTVAETQYWVTCRAVSDVKTLAAGIRVCLITVTGTHSLRPRVGAAAVAVALRHGLQCAGKQAERTCRRALQQSASADTKVGAMCLLLLH